MVYFLLGNTLSYFTAVCKYPHYVLNKGFLLHPISSIYTVSKIMKGSASLLEGIRSLTNDRMDNIKNNYNDIKNNVELHQHLEEGYRELDNYVNNTNLDELRYSNKTPSGRLGRDTQSTAGHFLYLIIRSLKPDTVVETGVASGESSTFMLQAMDDNKKGKLFSIDFPPSVDQSKRKIIFPKDKSSGWIIPGNLKDRWELHEGDSADLLLPLLQKLGTIDGFFHDSLHTYDHMMFEYKTSWDFMRNGGILFSDDVAIMNKKGRSPFVDFAKMHKKDIVVNHIVGAMKK